MDFLNQVTQGVAGLQNIQANQQEMQIRQEEMQRQQKKQADEAKAAEYLAQYQASEQAGTPDFTSLNKAILLSPTASQNVLTGIGIQDNRQKTQAASDVVSLYAAADSPEKFKQLIANRIQTVRDRGGDPKDSIELANIYETQGAEAARKSLQMVGAALANEGFVKADMIGLGGEQNGMTAFQQASTDLRKQELEFGKAQKATELQLKVLEAQMRKEDNELKRQDLQLKIQEQQQKLADMDKQKLTSAREKDAEMNQALFSIDNMMNTVERVRQSPKLNDVVGSIQGRFDAYIDDEAAATIRLIDGLGSQAFMAMVPSLKGMGALSNAEGDKLAASLQNLSRVTSEEAFKENLSEVERLMNKSRGFILQRYGKPEAPADVPASSGGNPRQPQVIEWSSLDGR